MIRIAVCDDTDAERESLAGAIRNYVRENRILECDVAAISSGKEFLERIAKERFDVYFLDVMMPDADGMELGRIIRAKDQEALIIYVTAFREFAYEAYRVQAFQYLQKPVAEEEIQTVLDQVFVRLREKLRERVCVHTKEGVANIDRQEIIYVENISRAAVYFLRGGMRLNGVCNRSSFEESVRFLDGEPAFIHPHKSYYVNMNYIRLFYAQNLVLENGTMIPVSKKRLPEVKRRYLDFLSRQGVLA